MQSTRTRIPRAGDRHDGPPRGDPSPQRVGYNAHKKGKKGGEKHVVPYYIDSIPENCPKTSTVRKTKDNGKEFTLSAKKILMLVGGYVNAPADFRGPFPRLRVDGDEREGVAVSLPAPPTILTKSTT